MVKEASVSDNPELRKRMLFILCNLMTSSKTAAEAVSHCELLEILMATAQLIGSENEQSKALARKALKAAEKWGLIAPNPDREDEDE